MSTITSDIPCQRCAYNLRGLDAEGTCPECGAPVLVALHGERLELADPEWLAKVSRGCTICHKGWAIFLYVLGFKFLLELLQAVVPASIYTTVQTMCLMIMHIGALACLCGYWLTATPHDRLEQNIRVERMRRAFRFSVVGMAFTVAIAIPAVQFGFTSLALIIAAIGAPLGLIGMIGAWGFSGYMEHFARRAGDEFNADRAAIYRKWFIVCWVPMAAGMAPLVFLGQDVLLYFAILGLIGVMAFGILILGLVDNLKSRLGEAAKLADHNWRNIPRR